MLLRALCILSAALPLTTAVALAAGTPQEGYEKRLRKVAPELTATTDVQALVAKPRALCSCVMDPNLSQSFVAGVLAYDKVEVNGDTVLQLTCYTAIFDAAGAVSIFFPCVSWEPLVK
jgi:hypothetical protein